jgi:hypothetical protein
VLLVFNNKIIKMKKIIDFDGQNWAITPVAPAANETRPQNIKQQKWQLVLSGVAISNTRSRSHNDWTGEEIRIYPDINSPLNYVINQFSIPVPTDVPYVITDGEFADGIRPLFQVEQMAAYAALGSVYDERTAVDAGFSVNTWRPFPFKTLVGAQNSPAPAITKIFEGLVVKVAVRDIDAWLYRVNYHITIIGKIVFARYSFPPIS